MTNNFLGTVAQIKTLTGLSVAVFTPGGELLCGEKDVFASIPKTHKLAGEKTVFTIKEHNLTCFTFQKNSVQYVGALKEVDSASHNYAVLLRAIFENAFFVPTALTKAESFKLYICGELSAPQVTAFKEKFAFDACHYYVLSLITDNAHKLPELKSFLDAIADQEDIVVGFNDNSVAFFKKCGNEEEYQSANDFANTLYDSIKEELRINIVINVGGTAHSFEDLPVFFHQCEFAYDFGKMLSPLAHIYSFKEYMMIKMLSDIPKSTLTQYLDTLLDKNSLSIFSDDELMNTAEEFYKNSLNVSETSRSMYMHRNTLIYRLEKIENATGLNLRYFNDAVIFKLMTILNKLTAK